MGDFVELGIEGVNKLVDQHFHKIPDKTFHPDHPIQKAGHKINPMNLSRRHRQKRYAGFESPSSSSLSSHSSDEEEMKMGIQKRNTEPIMPSQYSNEPPRLRQQYIPPPPIGQNLFTPKSPGLARARAEYDRSIGKARREWDESYYSDSPRAAAPRRPKAITRRSSSHPPRRGRSPSSPSSFTRGGLRDKAHDKAHRYGLKDETIGRFGASPAGITGSVFGALIGGWAAQKAQVAAGKERDGGRKRDEAGNKAVTLAGAVIGGLAVNAAVERWRRGKEEEGGKKQEKWERKFGDGSDGEEKDGGRRRGRRAREPDQEYGGERDGRGYDQGY